MITIQDINKAAREIIVSETLRLDKDRLREDLYGLYGEIVTELATRAPGQETLIYDYTELMLKEQHLYIPEHAYQAGAAARGAERDSALMDYLRQLHLNPDNQRFLNERDAMYRELCGFLGETSGLLNEFNELYRRCYGIIGQKIEVFFDMGHTGNDEPDESGR